MKAIYINLDPYLAAFAAWLKGGKSGPVPKFDPLPLAVTIPLGETACIFLPSGGEAETDPADAANEVTVSGQSLSFCADVESIPVDAIAYKVVPGISALAPSAKYYVLAVTGDTSAPIRIMDSENNYPITFTVLVRREQASGPVDLVDFTPPSSGGELTAAAINTALGGTGAVEGSPLKGVSLTDATGAPAPSAADIKSALVAAGDGALAGVKLGGAIPMITGDENTATKIQTDVPVDPGEEPVMVNDPKWANDNSYTVGGGAS